VKRERDPLLSAAKDQTGAEAVFGGGPDALVTGGAQKMGTRTASSSRCREAAVAEHGIATARMLTRNERSGAL
jgi:hypothetical protein